MIVKYSGSPIASEAIFANGLKQTDISPNSDPKSENWKYVMFPKEYYPSIADLKSNYRTMFDFAATKFEIAETDEIVELNRFFLLKRASSPTTVEGK